LNIQNGGSLGFAPNGDVLYDNDSVNGDWVYQYDDFNRVMQATCSASCPIAKGVAYTYDRYGNRWSETVTSGSGIQPSYTFDASNHASGAGVAFDAAGNLTTDGLGNSYVYDAESRLAALGGSNSASYVYNAVGRRVRAVVNSQSRDFLLDLEGRTVDEFTPGGGGLGVWSRGEAYAGAMHIATYANSTTTFEQDDWISNTRVRSNVSGTIVESCSNLPFGEDLTCSGTDVSPLHFTGKERDQESGDDYFGARYYSSTMARFLTPDWNAQPANIPYANLGDPQTLNLYAFESNQPLDRVDNDGHVWCSDKLGDCISDAQYDALKRMDDGECLYCFYTKHILDDKKAGLSEAEAQLLAMFVSSALYGRGRHLDSALKDILETVHEITSTVTIGLGAGGKLRIFRLRGTAEAAVKDNLTFSNGKLSAQDSIELGIVGGVSKQWGLSISASQTFASFDLNTMSFGGTEPTEVEWTVGGKSGGTQLEASSAAITLGGEVGGEDGVLAGGSIAITRAGVQDVVNAAKELWHAF
jgi:RHS repeat-associated protein